jgi:hypothetical protein
MLRRTSCAAVNPLKVDSHSATTAKPINSDLVPKRGMADTLP